MHIELFKRYFFNIVGVWR